MKVLYIGHHSENTGWGEAAENYIRALDHVGIDVVPRSIRLRANPREKHPRILELEKKSAKGCDICIQHILPHYIQYNSHFRKNIGLVATETKNIKHTSWISHLKLMDEVWIPYKDADIPLDKVYYVPHTFDMKKYNKEYKDLNMPQLNNKFTFYFIGEFSLRKRLSALLRAFHTEFSPKEPVELVLKLNKPGVNSNDLANEVVEFCNQIKSNLKLYNNLNKYKPEIIITVHIGDDELMSLHKMCDCFVVPSYGEAFCLPAFSSMAMGNIVVSGNHGGMKDYIIDGYNGYLVDGKFDQVFGQHETFPEFGKAYESWFDISIQDLMKNMRKAYQTQQQSPIKRNAIKQSQNYNYEIIGNQMKELLSV